MPSLIAWVERQIGECTKRSRHRKFLTGQGIKLSNTMLINDNAKGFVNYVTDFTVF